MRSIVVLSLIVLFMFIAYMLHKWLQKILKPRKSFVRLLFYFVAVLISVFILSFLMVLIISTIYPNELMK